MAFKLFKANRSGIFELVSTHETWDQAREEADEIVANGGKTHIGVQLQDEDEGNEDEMEWWETWRETERSWR